jgi:hypothetical protein
VTLTATLATGGRFLEQLRRDPTLARKRASHALNGDLVELHRRAPAAASRIYVVEGKVVVAVTT